MHKSGNSFLKPVNYLNIITSALLACSLNAHAYAQAGELEPISPPSFCTAKPSECSRLGMISQTVTKSNGEKRCNESSSVLCTAPEITARPDIADANRQFNVLSYNIFDRPFIISHDGQRERVCRIPGQIFRQIASKNSIDAIVIQEAFTEGCRSGAELRTLLSYYGFAYSTATIDQASSLSNGGLFIASKWPIQLSKQDVFESCTGSDCLAAKGAIYARIDKKVTGKGSTMTYHLFGAHFNAWGGKKQTKVRLKQAKQLGSFINRQHIPTTEAVIIAGDLNIDKHDKTSDQSEVTGVLNTMHAAMPVITGDQHYTTNPVHNPLAIESESSPQWLDYVLYSKQHLKPVESSIQAIALRTAKEFKACMKARLQPYDVYPDSQWCKKTASLTDLSDHYPVLGRFKY